MLGPLLGWLRLASSKKLGVIGCGAITQQRIVPALREIPECSVGWFADTNLSNARRAASNYGQGEVTDDYCSVVPKVDAAIVAVPNHLHSKVSVDFLEAGRDVLCEKPIANNSINARAMIEASRRSGARLAINMVRRRFDSYRAAKLLLRKSFLGRIQQIDYKQGNYQSWPFCSSYILHKHESGGGVS